MSSGRDPYLAYIHRFFGRWAPLYDAFAASIAPVYRRLVQTLAPAPGQRLLDLCTGTGLVAHACARRGARVTGIDITPAMLLRARRKRSVGAPGWVLMDVRHLAFVDAGFERAVLSFALHDMPRPVRLAALREAARASGGQVTILDYAMPTSPLLARLVTTLIGTFESAYFRGFVGEEATALFAAAGLRVTSRRWILPGFAIWTLASAAATEPEPTVEPPARPSRHGA